MRKVLLALIATFAVCLAVFAGTTMCVKKQNGDILRINVDDVYEVYFEDIFNPDTSSIIPPFIEPTVADTSAYAPLRFRITSDSTVELTYGNYRDLDSVNIPAKVKIDGKVYSVTSIGSDAFAGGGRLTSIEIPSSVTSIGERAFAGCGSLTSIEIPSSVTSIGEGAFMECSSLTSIAIPSSVTSIGSYTFGYCSRLTSVEIPSSVTSIGEYAFEDCSKLTSVEIPSSVTSIGEYAFYYCISLTSITIPASVTSIGSSTFYGCSSLESINVDAKNPNYSSLDGIVYNKEKTEIIAVPKGIKGSISIPSSVTSIGSEAFSNCSSLTSIEIPSSVTSIGSEAFRYCSSMTSVEIPSSVTSIGSNAFRDCKNLDVVIDNSKENVKFYNYWEKETTIENSYAFYGVKSVKWLKEIDEDPSVADTSAYAPLKFWITSDSTVELTYGNYRDLDSVNIPAKVKIDGKAYSVTKIGDGALSDKYSGCFELTSVAIPSSVTSIDYYAFSGCSSLASIEIPSSVTSIGDGAFEYCSSLTSVEIPSSVTEIGSFTFSGCSSLTSVAIPSSVTSIDYYAFSGCWSLTSIEIPSSVTSIGSYAFSGCSSLKEINIPSSVTEIGDRAFSGCSSINVDAKNPNYSSLDGIFYNKEKTEIIAVPNGIKGSISIPESVTSIGSSAFSGCSSLTSIEIPSSVTSIGSSAFWGCRSLTSIEIPSSVTEIGGYAFEGCSSLESINVDAKNPNYSSLDGIVYNKEKTEIIAVPEGIKGSISIPEGVTSIGDRAFSGSSSFTSITIPSSVTSIGSSAFYNCENLDVVIDNSNENVKVESFAFYNVKSVKWLK